MYKRKIVSIKLEVVHKAKHNGDRETKSHIQYLDEGGFVVNEMAILEACRYFAYDTIKKYREIAQKNGLKFKCVFIDEVDFA